MRSPPRSTVTRKLPTIPRSPRAIVAHVMVVLGCGTRRFVGRVGKYWPREVGLGFVAERRVRRHGRVRGKTSFRFRSPTERVVSRSSTERVVGPRHHYRLMLIEPLFGKGDGRGHPAVRPSIHPLLLQRGRCPSERSRSLPLGSLPLQRAKSQRRGVAELATGKARQYSTWI